MINKSKNFQELINFIDKKQLVCFKGDTGVGKTTLINEYCKSHENCIYIDFKVSNHTSFLPIAIALGKKISDPHTNLNYLFEFLNKTKKEIIILDHLELCENDIFRTIFNVIKASRSYNSTKVIIIFNDSLFNERTDRNEYKKDLTEFYILKFDHQKEDIIYYKNILAEKDCVDLPADKLLELLNLVNFNLYAIIEALNLAKVPVSDNYFNEIKIMLLKSDIKKRLSLFENKQIEIIQKTATFGYEFNSQFIKACFDIAEIDVILRDIMVTDHKIYKKIKDNIYSFYNEDTRNCIYLNLSENQKIELNKKIASYCLEKSEQFLSLKKRICYVYSAYQHYKDTNVNSDILNAGLKLLKLYELNYDLTNIIILANEMYNLSDGNQKIYLGLYLAQCLSDNDKYTESNIILKEIENLKGSVKSFRANLYIKLMIAQNSYVSSATYETEKIIYDLDRIISEDIDNVLKYKFYSMSMSYFENIGIYDKKEKYRKKAIGAAKKCYSNRYLYLLYVKSLISDNETTAIKNIKKAIDYFKDSKEDSLLAQIFHNYGSAQLFCCNFDEAEVYLKKAFDQYISTGSVWLSYSYNNLAIIYFLENNVDQALNYWLKPYPCNTELFTKVTISCNVICCYLKLKKFNEAKTKYDQTIKLINNHRKEETSLYIEIYMKIIKALIEYHSNNKNSACEMLSEIKIPNGYEFLNEFISGMCSKLNGYTITYSFPYIKKYVENEVYLCDLLFIE